MPVLIRLPFAIAAAMLAASATLAQDAPPAPILYATKADVAAAMARAAAALKPGQPMASSPVLLSGPYRASLEYRVGPAGGAVHVGQIELVQVLEGSGAVTMGGTLDKTPAGNVVSGGVTRRIAAGDVFLVPAAMPHAFTRVDGHLALLTIKLPAQ